MPSNQRFLTVVCVLPFAISVLAQPNLSGVWQVKHKTDDIHIKIDQQGSNVAITMRVASEGQQQQQLAFRFTVGAESRNEIHGAPMTSRTEWDGSTLVVRSLAVIGGKELRMTDRWVLASDGKTLTRSELHQYGSEPEGEDVLILDRRPDSAWQPDAPPKMAEETYKNIQVLKGVPAPQLMKAMNFFTQWLGVKCDHCHVAGAFEKDDKPAKVTARAMWRMVHKINEDNFAGSNPVTCWTCHRGQTKPQSLPPQ
jgi:hypothetical protein